MLFRSGGCNLRKGGHIFGQGPYGLGYYRKDTAAADVIVVTRLRRKLAKEENKECCAFSIGLLLPFPCFGPITYFCAGGDVRKSEEM